MKVLVLGSGVAGVTAAFELLRDGHEVTVLDRLPAAALETSFANAGLVAPGHSFAWASPKAPKILWNSVWTGQGALRFKPSLDPALWSWMAKFLAQCTAERARRNTLRKHALCLYAQTRLGAVVEETGVDYDGRTDGLLYLYRSEQSLARGVQNMRILAEDGQEQEVVDPDRAAEIDPALEPVKQKIAGGVYCPTDGSGDARKFTQGLAEVCKAKGAAVLFDTEVARIEAEGDRITGVVVRRDGVEDVLRAEAYVLSAGCWSPALARSLGYRLPIYPVKGYSVTIPVAGANNPPTIGGVDEDNLIAWCPLGDRVRVTATAEFSGWDKTHTPRDFDAMLTAIRDLFPNAGDYTKPDRWAGLRPMTPEGTPILGRGRHANLYFNAGHGHMGWTMSCGTARITADLVSGKEPSLPLDGMHVR